MGPVIVRERDIEAHLVKRVKELGGEIRKVKWIGRRGAPDRVILRDPARAVARLALALQGDRLENAHGLLHELIGMVIIWPELKAPGKKPEPHQLREHKRMQAMGQRVVVIDSIEGIEELLS